MSSKKAAPAHALLSASSAERWLNCPASIRLSEGMPDLAGDAAREGTLAHAIAELKLRKQYTEPMGKATFTRRMNKLIKDNDQYNPEMQRYTDQYLEFVNSITYAQATTPFVEVEKQVNYSAYAPEGFGTADCIVIHGNHLWVIDFKYGKHVKVDAGDNSQLKLYALGALAEYGFIYPIQTVTLCVVQPRMDNIVKWDTDVAALYQWGNEVVKPLAEEAYASGGTCVPGKHCQFCPIKPVCKAYAGQYDVKEEAIKDPQTMNAAEMAWMLAKLEGVVSYHKKLKEYALAKALEGLTIPGFKVVEGRSTRSFKDLDVAFQKIKEAGFDESLLYERVPLTLTSVEKLLGKTQFDSLLAADVVKPQGKPTLVPEDDKREPFKPKSAAEVFKDIQV